MLGLLDAIGVLGKGPGRLLVALVGSVGRHGSCNVYYVVQDCCDESTMVERMLWCLWWQFDLSCSWDGFVGCRNSYDLSKVTL